MSLDIKERGNTTTRATDCSQICEIEEGEREREINKITFQIKTIGLLYFNQYIECNEIDERERGRHTCMHSWGNESTSSLQ